MSKLVNQWINIGSTGCCFSFYALYWLHKEAKMHAVVLYLKMN